MAQAANMSSQSSADVAEWQTRYVQVVVHLVSVGSTPTVGTIFSTLMR